MTTSPQKQAEMRSSEPALLPGDRPIQEMAAKLTLDQLASIWLQEEPHLAEDFDSEPPALPDGSPVQPNKKPKQPQASGFNFKTIGELMNEPEAPTDWLLDGLLVRGTVSLLAAKPKTGKSVLARGLALAVAQGRPFLDRTTKQGDALYLCLEERQQDVRRDFQQMGATGREPLLIEDTAMPGIAGLCMEIRARRPAFVVVDPLQRLARIENGNDYSQTYASLSPLIEISRETLCHILLLHHTAKVEREAVVSPLGSTGLAAAVSSILVLRRYGDLRSLESVQRTGHALAPTLLYFDENTKTLSIGGSVAGAVGRRASEMVLELLARRSELTQADIRDDCQGIGSQHVRTALTTLLEEGKIHSSGSGKRGDPLRYSISPKGGFAGFSGFSDTPSPHAKPETRNAGESETRDEEEVEEGGFGNRSSIVKPAKPETRNPLQPHPNVGEKVVSPSAVASENQKPDFAPGNESDGQALKGDL